VNAGIRFPAHARPLAGTAPDAQPTADPPPVVEVHGLAHRYPDGTPALRGVDLRIVQGESVAVVGANGAGKSTLLLHLNIVRPMRAISACG
jgi:cobalt/nickel transport system ATP-binding protein